MVLLFMSLLFFAFVGSIHFHSEGFNLMAALAGRWWLAGWGESFNFPVLWYYSPTQVQTAHSFHNACVSGMKFYTSNIHRPQSHSQHAGPVDGARNY